jgi:hypothetical protein
MGVRVLGLLLLGSSVTAMPLSARAVTLRYSLVIGNNQGRDEGGLEVFAPLQHAEREAETLYERLIELANFDATEERILLLRGATRAQVVEAAERLAARKAADEEQYGHVDSLFLFFFTGHGLQGRLLLDDGPLTAQELAGVFRTVDATFRIGVFDACYSGSLEATALSEKGIELTPGINLFGELPDEVLTAEGSVWLVSSGPGEVSYEDQTLGGVFTHFIIEALERAPADGPGITLDSVWNYARRKTVAYTSRRRRRQVPQQLVTKLRASGPLYLSFPAKRSARLVLAGSLAGRFVLTYADGQLMESIDKRRGAREDVPVYPGSAVLSFYRDGQVLVQENIRFVEGAPVVLRGPQDLPPIRRPGEGTTDLWIKGAGGNTLVATATEPRFSAILGAGLYQAVGEKGILAPERGVLAWARLDHGAVALLAGIGYGRAAEEYSTWSYALDAWHGELRGGLALNVGSARLTGGLLFAADHSWQRYGDGSRRRAWTLQPGGFAALLYPSSQIVSVELSAAAGPARSPGVGQRTEAVWSMRASVGVAVMLRL